jgi:hypothetical protein
MKPQGRPHGRPLLEAVHTGGPLFDRKMRKMSRTERRELVERFLDDLRAQRKVDMRDAMEELIHLVFELEGDVRELAERVARLEARAADQQ